MLIDTSLGRASSHMVRNESTIREAPCGLSYGALWEHLRAECGGLRSLPLRPAAAARPSAGRRPRRALPLRAALPADPGLAMGGQIISTHPCLLHS